MNDEALTPIEALQELRSWLKFKLEYGPIKHQAPESIGPYNDHPKGYAAVLFPDWDVRQKVDMINEALLFPSAEAQREAPNAD